MWRLLATGWWDCVERRLAAGPQWLPGASADSLVGRLRVQKAPGLLPTYWWVKPNSGVSARLVAGRAGSWSLVAEPRDPRAGVRWLVAGWGGAVPDTADQGLKCPEARVVLLVGRVWLVVFLYLVSALWWVRLIQWLEQAS